MEYISPKYKKMLGLNTIQSEHFLTETERFVVISRTTSASLVYLSEGKVQLTSGENSFWASKGDVIWFPNGILYRAVWQGNPELDFYSLHWTEASGKFYPLQKIQPLSRPDVLLRFSEVHRRLSESPFESEIWKAAAQLCGLIADAIPYLTQSERPGYPEALSAALLYCEEHFREHFSVEMLAKTCHISSPRLYGIFRSYLRTTPVSYLNSLRIMEAFRLLNETTMTVEAISEQCGFGTANYFREVFHEAVGMSPAAYRRSSARPRPV